MEEKRKIDVDDAVWELIKKNAQESGESPNEVLKRLLSGKTEPKPEKKHDKSDKDGDWACF